MAAPCLAPASGRAGAPGAWAPAPRASRPPPGAQAPGPGPGPAGAPPVRWRGHAGGGGHPGRRRQPPPAAAAAAAAAAGDADSSSSSCCAEGRQLRRGSAPVTAAADGRARGGERACAAPESVQLSGAAIMRQLKAARDWRELEQLVQAHGAVLTWRHSSALLTHLAQLTARHGGARAPAPGAQEQQQHQQQHQQQQPRRQPWPDGGSSGDARLAQFVAGVLPLVDGHLASYDARGLANTLWALARLQAVAGPPGRPWLARFFAASEPLLPAFDGQQLANALWALAQLQQSPPAPWLAGWQRALAAQLAAAGGGGPRVELQALSSAMWSATLLAAGSSQAAPAAALVDQLLAAAAAQLPGSGGGSGQAVANLLWSCAQLEHCPQPGVLAAVQAWLTALAAEGPQAQRQVSDQALANMLWALGKLHKQQQLQQQQQQRGASRGEVEDGSPDQERRDSGSHASTSSSRTDAAASRVGEAHPDGVAFLLRGCGQLLLDASTDRLGSLSWRHVSNAAWAAGALQLQPRRRWVAQLGTRLQGQAAQLSDQQVANVAWGLSQLPAASSGNGGHAAPRAALERLLDAQQARLGGFGSQALSSTLLSAARLGCRLPEPLLQAWLRELACRNFLAAAGGRAATDACAALALMRRAEEAAAAAAATGAPGAGLGAGLRRRGAGFQHSFDSEWLAGFCAATGPRLAGFGADQLAGVGWAMAALRFRPPLPWLLAWQAALVDRARGMSGEAASKALWALRSLAAGPGGDGKAAAAASLAAAAVAAAAASGCSAHSLAVSASCIAAGAAEGASASSARPRGGGGAAAGAGGKPGAAGPSPVDAVQQLLRAAPPVLGSCSGQQLQMLLSAAAAVDAPLPASVLRPVLARVQQLAVARQLDGPAAARILAAVARLCAAAPLHGRGGEEEQQQQQRVRPSRAWLRGVLDACHLAHAGPVELTKLLWALAALDSHPGRPWLRRWVRHSQARLPAFGPGQLASAGWALAVLNHRPGAAWRGAWVQAAGLQAAAAAPAQLALVLYAAAVLGCEPPRAWLADAAAAAAGGIGRWRLRDMCAGLWGAARLGLRAVADGELLEVLVSRMTAASSVDALAALSPHQQLQLLQAAVLLRAPAADDAEARDALAAAAGPAARRAALPSASAVRRMRWRARAAAERAGAAGAAAMAAAREQQQLAAELQQQRRQLHDGAEPPAASAAALAAAAAATQERVAAWEAAVGEAAAAAAAVVAATTGRSPDAVGLPLDGAWLRAWCRASLAQLHAWPPSVAAGALAAFAALGVQPPLAWQQQVLAQVARRSARRGLARPDGEAITHALALLQSPLLAQWSAARRVTYAPGRAAPAPAAGPLERRRAAPWLKGPGGAGQGGNGGARYPQQLGSHGLLALRRQQRAVRLAGWWRRQQQLQQQRRAAAQQAAVQRQWRGVAAADAARAVWQRSGGTSLASPATSVDGAAPLPWGAAPPPGARLSRSAAGVDGPGSGAGAPLPGRAARREWLPGGAVLAQRPVRQVPAPPPGGAAGSAKHGSGAGESDAPAAAPPPSNGASAADAPAAAVVLSADAAVVTAVWRGLPQERAGVAEGRRADGAPRQQRLSWACQAE
ncbi:hypothetical protein HT031_002092 [Scenedesmus sp. PABB004]|nr:hypothetical protein HT031_002092 [Scenedesmus sp. PABB004]